MVAFASSLDQAGPMAHDVRDCAIMLEAMAGFDPRDATSLDFDVPKWEAGLSGDLKGKKAGIPKEYRVENMPTEIEALWQQGIDWLKDAGAEIIEVSLPPTRYALGSEEHTSELQSLMRISYAVFCLKKKHNSTYIQ